MDTQPLCCFGSLKCLETDSSWSQCGLHKNEQTPHNGVRVWQKFCFEIEQSHLPTHEQKRRKESSFQIPMLQIYNNTKNIYQWTRETFCVLAIWDIYLCHASLGERTCVDIGKIVFTHYKKPNWRTHQQRYATEFNAKM